MELGDTRVSMNVNEDIGPIGGEKAGDGPDSSNSGVNAVMPDIYATQSAPKAIDITVVSRSTTDTDESPGFDPYDTATLHKK
jgi:hypothetical protein